MVLHQVNSYTELLMESNLPSLGRGCCDYGKTCIKRYSIFCSNLLMNAPTDKPEGMELSVNHTCFLNVLSCE